MTEKQTYETEFNNGNNGRKELAGLTYDEKLRKWTETTVQSTSKDDILTQPEEPTAENQKQNVSDSQKKDSQFKAEKEYIEIEYNTLQGDATLLPTKKTIRLTQGKTVILNGLGKFLSGQYFISNIRRSISSSNGYSQTCTFIKTGFGDSLKAGNGKLTETDLNRPNEVKVQDAVIIEINSRVAFTGDDAVYANAHDGVKVPKWVKSKDNLTVSQISPDGTRALVQPINSWTYTKYLKKI